MEETEFEERLNEALNQESDYDKFCNLGQVAQDTQSSDMPNEIKSLKIKKIEALQMGLVDGLAIELK